MKEAIALIKFATVLGTAIGIGSLITFGIVFGGLELAQLL